jgi:hypothetical protein
VGPLQSLASGALSYLMFAGIGGFVGYYFARKPPSDFARLDQTYFPRKMGVKPTPKSVGVWPGTIYCGQERGQREPRGLRGRSMLVAGRITFAPLDSEPARSAPDWPSPASGLAPLGPTARCYKGWLDAMRVDRGEGLRRAWGALVGAEVAGRGV